VVKRTMDFVPLETALKADWVGEASAKKLKRKNAAIFLLTILFEFQSREGRSPDEANKENDLKLLGELRQSILDKYSLPEQKIPQVSLRFY